ncbi:MAG: hypothetical protein QM640_07355 [Niabella sp.]
MINRLIIAACIFILSGCVKDDVHEDTDPQSVISVTVSDLYGSYNGAQAVSTSLSSGAIFFF